MSVHPITETKIKFHNHRVIDETLLQKYEKIAVRHLIQKLDRRLLPYLFLIEIGSYINRISTGYAKTMGMQIDLKLEDCQIELSISLFFLAYLIFAIPSSILMRFIGPTNYLSLSILVWGILTIGMAFIKNSQDLLIVQILLGVTQAGFFLSMVIYFSLWYRKRDQTMRIALLVGAATVAGGLGSLLAYGLRHMNDIFGLRGWQWMFLLEGLPMIPLGVITYLFLSSIPTTVQWLDNCEKQLLTNILRDDAGIANRENIRFSWRQAFYVFVDFRIYLYALIGICNLGVIKYLNAYLPAVVEDIGSLKAYTPLLAIPPYVLAFVCCLSVSYSSSRKHEYGFHIMFCLSIALIGFVLATILIGRSSMGVYISESIACCGAFSAYPLIFSWLTNNISGHTKRSMAVGFVLGIGQLGGVMMLLMGHDPLTRRRNTSVFAGITVASLIFTIILRISLMIENRRRDRLSREQYNRESAVQDPCDWHPQVRYIL